MRLGAQISTAGGLHKAFERGAEVGCDSIMIFTKSNRQWKAKPLDEKAIDSFHNAASEFDKIYPVAVHASYLINIGSSDEALWEKSYQALKVEVERAEALSISTVTFHPGAFIKADEETGLSNIARGLNRLLEETKGFNTLICLETMSGTGTTLGFRFEHLANLIEQVQGTSQPERIGVCFDTCHVFSAGYDIRTPEEYEKTLAQFDKVVGLERIKCFHFNDSKHDFGERKDRHEHIGRGAIGLEGFRHFVNDPRWADHPAHLETPKVEEDEEGNEIQMDVVNLATLRDLIN
ncbi:MAG: deoxyribonuclease IV [Anaerolineae bacterium]|nr:MAG: deoxyribonuclease IV [Anaerolineae bacterium]